MKLLKKLFSKPETRRLTVTSSNGFHLRPVAQFVNTAKAYELAISASFQEKTVNAKAVNTLLSLNLDRGDSFTLTAKGTQATQALDALEACFLSLMQEEKEVTATTINPHHYTATSIQAQSISSGIAIAPLYRLTHKELYQPSGISLQKASHLAKEELELLYQTQEEEHASISLAQKELLDSLLEEEDNLESFEQRVRSQSQALQGGKLEAKRVDYLDILQRVKRHLGYTTTLSLPQKDAILVADDLLPSDIMVIEKSTIQGVILKDTTPTSHTAILLKAAGIPSMILRDIPTDITTSVILDADAAVLVVSPTQEDIAKAQTQQEKNQSSFAQAYQKRLQPARSRAGVQIEVLANISDVASAKTAKEEGAEGIGLLRTEFLFDTHKPTVATQEQAYKEIFSLFSNITVRTLDIGGDKALPYVSLPHEKNPFLGIRGVRLFKTHPELLEEQLLAIFRAAESRALKIMFPMVATVAEFVEAKAFAQRVAHTHALDISQIQFGIMIEVPSVLFLISAFNEVVDFYSVGTNDLTQYLFAIERTHPSLQTDSLSPVVFDVLEKIRKESTKPVSICGELASEAKAIKALLALGYTQLSMSPKHIPSIKERIRNS